MKGVQCGFISIQAGFSLFLSVFLSSFLNLSCTQYQYAYKNVLFIIILSKMSNKTTIRVFFVIHEIIKVSVWCYQPRPHTYLALDYDFRIKPSSMHFRKLA